jgi:hypothetical protein
MKAARIVKGASKLCDINESINEQSQETLADRKQKVALLYKIKNGLAPDYLSDPYILINLLSTLHSSNTNILLIHCYYESYSTFFFSIFSASGILYLNI